MPLSPMISIAGADRLGPGVFLAQFTGAGSIAVGTNSGAMTLIAGQIGQRLYIYGPCYVYQYGSTSSITEIQVRISEAGSTPAAVGGGHEPPGMGG